MRKRGRDDGSGDRASAAKKKAPSSVGLISVGALRALQRAQAQPAVMRKSVMAAETKYFDTSFAFTVAGAADWTGTEVACSNYIQSDGTTVGAYTDCALIPSAIGAGYGQVSGNKYLIKQIRVRGEFSPAGLSDQADVGGPRFCRVVLVHDTQPNGAQAQGEDVFTDMGSAAQCNYSFLAMAGGAGGRFRILADETVMLETGLAGTDGANTNSVSWNGKFFSFYYRPKKPIQVFLKANSSTPTVASLSDANIFMLAHMNNTSPVVTLNGCARCYYID